jgi:hypothetical protein
MSLIFPTHTELSAVKAETIIAEIIRIPMSISIREKAVSVFFMIIFSKYYGV